MPAPSRTSSTSASSAPDYLQLVAVLCQTHQSALISDPCFAPQHTVQWEIMRQSRDRSFHPPWVGKRWRFHGKVTYSPPPSSDPWRLTLRNRARNAANDATSSAAFRPSAVSIKSVRKTP